MLNVLKQPLPIINTDTTTAIQKHLYLFQPESTSGRNQLEVSEMQCNRSVSKIWLFCGTAYKVAGSAPRRNSTRTVCNVGYKITSIYVQH